MNEHRFKVGDKVVADRGIATVIKADDDETYSYRLKFVNGYRSWYDETELKPVSDNTFKVDKDGTFCVTGEELGFTKEEIASMWKEANEKEKQEHKLPSPDDLLTKEEMDKLLSSVPTHSEDRDRLEKMRKSEENKSTIMDEDTQTFLEKCKENGWKKVDIKQKAHDEGYKEGVDETWEYIRKLFQLDYMTSEKLFGSYYIARIIHEYTASEVIEKLKTYEKNNQFDEALIREKLEVIVAFYGTDRIAKVLKQMKEESNNE